MVEFVPGSTSTPAVLVESGSESKINALTAITLPAAVDEFVVVDDPAGTPVTRKITHDDVLFGAAGTPSTQAHGDAASKGTALDAARSDHKHAMPAAGGGASVLVESGSESKINALTAITVPAAVDEFVIVDDPGGTPVTRKITHDDVLFGANGTPSTQAHGDSAAIGTALDAARSDHKHAMPAAGGGAVTREGGNTTEATTTSTSDTDLLTASSLTIATAVPFEFVFGHRKTSGAGDDCAWGLKLNSTTVGISHTGTNSLGVTSTDNEAQSGGHKVGIGARATNYLRNAWGNYFTAGTSVAGNSLRPTRAADMPTAEITDVVIRALTDSASNTAGADELHVYSLAIA